MVVVRVCNSSTWKTKAEDSKLKELGYIEKLSQNQKQLTLGLWLCFSCRALA